MKRKRKFGVSVLFLIYLALLVWIILFKLQFNINDLDTVRKINIIPFYYDKEIGVDFHIKEVLENLLIFVPMGIYLQMLLFKSKSYLKLLIIAGISLLLEITQYILAIGSSDITDLITNTAGGLLGIALYSIVARLLKSREKADKLFLVIAVIVSTFIIGLLALLFIFKLIGGVLMKKKQLTTEKRLGVQLYLVLFLYTVTGIGLGILAQFIFPKFDSKILSWLYWRIDMIFIFYLIIGFVCIFNYFWKKPWGYLDEVISATQTVYEQNDHPVALSDPLKELEEQLNQIKLSVLLSKQVAKEAEDRKNEIVMYLAHDIRTPLTTVIGYLSLLHEAPDMPEKQKEKYVQIALSKAERLEKLINELFEITKYNAHTVSLKKEKVDLQCLLAQVVDEIYPSLSAKGNSAAFTVDDDLVVYADPEKLARVFSNLLKNAAAYSYPNTEIIITAKRCGNSVQINFENHGRTIEPEQISGIFEKFNRLDEARLSDTGGAGLGLSIAEEIIRLHGGTITAFSENEMVSFVIMLPISD